MSKVIRYIKLIPFRLQEYGLRVTVNKIIVDLSLKLGVPIPQNIRWQAAHSFHTRWKLQQKQYYGTKEYNRRIDEKSREVLTMFYETGLDYTGKTVCDVGCGTRGILPIIKAQTKIGIDPTLGKIWDSFEFEPDCIYINEKAEEITLADETVDIVTCNNALNHFENPLLALAQMHRILRKGGLLLFEVFIEPQNIAHTINHTPEQYHALLSKYFTPILVKHEPLQIQVTIDEKLDGKLPHRWGGVFKK